MIILSCVGLLIILLLVGMPIAVAMGLTAVVFLLVLAGPSSFVVAAKVMADSPNDFLLLTIPIFILMGAIMMKGGIGDVLFDFFDSLFGHLSGGVGIATVLSCAVLGSMCGSSVGITAAIGGMAVKNLYNRGYSAEMACGLPASAGGIGILMPASIGMILYSSITQASVAKLLMAGLIPALLTVIFFSLYTVWAYQRNPNKVSVPRKSWAERWNALKHASWALTIPVVLIGGVYGGFATVTEIASVACAWSLIVSLCIYRRITIKDLFGIFRYGLSTSVMVMFLIATAILLGNVLTQMGVPALVNSMFVGKNVPIWAFLLITMVYLVILGTALDGASMMLLTMPVLTPVLMAYHYDLIAYAVMFNLNVELSLLSPPVGLTVQTVEGIAKYMEMPITSATAWKGCLPFFIIYTIVLILVAIFPSLATFIPSHMG
jgi:C4-dicarboxylate transporter, DctM subunit